MSDDLRKRYEEVNAKHSEAKQRYLEAQATVKALHNRREELSKEAAALGVADIEDLDTTIEALEAEIEQELAEIESVLDSLDNDEPVDIPEETPTKSALSLDELLNEGGQP